MKAEQLWASILQEAIQGKLVPQLESEPEVNYIGEVPEDIPFAIPEKWKWAKLGDLVVFNPKVALDDKLEATFLPMAAVSAGYENKVNTKERRFWKKIKTGYSKFADGDIIMAKITPCFQNLKSAICRNLYNGVGAGSTEFHVIRPNSLLNPEYLLIFLKSPYLITYGIENFKGTAGQQRIGTTDLKKCFVPLPPLEEQRRIVACIQGLRSYIGSYQQEEQQLAILQSSFREKLRASILQEAIQGKLVPQLESEPVTPQIGEVPNNLPFNIPEKWRWVFFGNIVECLDRKRVPIKKSDRENMKKEFDYYGATGVIDRVSDYIFDERLLLIGEDGANLLSKTKDNAFFAEGKYWVNNHAHVIRGSTYCSLDYLAIYINAISLSPYVTGSAQPKLTLKNLFSIPVPLPPMMEQDRIVLQVEKLQNQIQMINLLNSKN